MQIYKEISILTSQPNLQDTKIVRHHLYGFKSVRKIKTNHLHEKDSVDNPRK